MGTTVSHYPSTPANYPVFSITIRGPDKIKVMDAPENVVSLVNNALLAYYGAIQDVDVGFEGGTRFKLSGCPFSKSGGFDLSVQSKYFFTRLVADLYEMGWKLWLNSDLSRLYDNSTLFFHRVAPPRDAFSICCLSLSHHDKFQLINAPDVLYQVLLACVGNLLQDAQTYKNCYSVKMHGYLWDNDNYDESTNARILLLNIFRNFRLAGFSFFGTVNTKGTADSILFINEESTTPPPPEEYCIVSLNAKDRLRLIECPHNLVNMTAHLLKTRWPGGIQDHFQEGKCVEFKMKGYPWYAGVREDAVVSRHFLAELLKESVAHGWAVLTAIDISRKAQDKANDDKIRIIGADAQVREYVAEVVRQCWTPGIQEESTGYAEDYQLKMRGCPWECSTFSDSFALARIMMTRILTSLKAIGWSVICSADVSAKYITEHRDNHKKQYPEDVHSWFVAQTSLLASAGSPPGVAPSAPVEADDAPSSYTDVVGS
ncbi:hypothetical protein QR680_005071 [Steinernema hermaphroditum]|uniref:Uncharacterized protein n=1 Tax=Steinernema hermaphroditum TaxID=289476 RepID=A0AA39HQS0_9BILA|nr:hypothetical protein QR680_005071 [Steinernema hermaphroditum]